MSQLRIYLTHAWSDANSQSPWALLDDAGALQQSGLGSLSGMPHADECVAIVSATDVLCVSQTLPKLKARQLETALPLLLEEFILGEPADNHVVPGKLLEDGRTVLYAIDKIWLRQFVEACSLTRIRLRRVLPEYALLPVQDGKWSVLWDGVSGYIAMSHYRGSMLGHGDAQHAPAGLMLHLASSQPSPAVRVFSPIASSGEQPVLPEWDGVVLDQSVQTFDWRTLRLNADMPNLLWGKFAAPIRLQEWWPKIRPLAGLLLLVLAIETIGYNLQWWSLLHEKNQLQRAMNSVFLETFGNDMEVMDAPLQMRRSLAHQRHAVGVVDDADFLQLLERVSAELAAQAGSQVTGLRYTEGQLDVEARLPVRDSFDALQQRLSEQGLRSQVIEVKENGSGVDVHLRLSSGGAR